MLSLIQTVLVFALLFVGVPNFVHAAPFTQPLAQGSSGAEVTALQQILIQQGYLKASPTGFFGSLTAGALAKFQTANGIDPLGSVGPKTRSLLNNLSSPTTAPLPVTCTGGVTITRFLGLGSSGTDVTALQKTLVTLALLKATPTGYYGSLTQAAVRAFQKSKQLEQTGTIDAKTRAALAALSCSTATPGTSPGGGAKVSPPATGSGAGAPSTIQNYTPPAISGGGGGGSVVTTPAAATVPSPTLTFTSNVASITSGGNVTLTWSALNAVSCTASGSWSGSKSVSGSLLLTNITVAPSYTLTCTGAGGSIFQTIVVAVVPPPIPPDVTAPTITNPAPLGTLPANTTQVSLTVTTNESASCGYANSNVSFSAMTAFSTTGATNHSALVTGLTNGNSYTYYVACRDTSGNTSPNTMIVFSVATPATPLPTITLTASPVSVLWGGSSNLTWSTTNASSCTASGGWSGNKATSGSQAFSNLTANQTFTIQCSGAGGSATQSTSITVTGSAPDTTVPSTPTGLSGSATSQTQISLTWTASTDNVGVTNYRVFRGGTQIASPSGTSYSDTGLTAATQYTYTVKAADAAGNVSATSNSVNITTQSAPVADVTPPSVTITAPAANLAAGTTQTSLSVTTNEAATCRYATISSASYASMSSFSTTGTTSHTVTLISLTDSTSYTYYVKCQDTAGNLSGNASVIFSIASPADTTAPSTPSGLTATTVSSSQITLSWGASTDAVGVAGYKIFRNTVEIASGAGTVYSDTGLSASTLYTYTVKAFDAAGNISNASASASATTQAIISSGGGGPVTYGPDAYGTTWKPLRVGAGGWLTGLDIATDGTKVVRTDTYGAYLWNGTEWAQLVTAVSMPVSEVNLEKAEGVYEIRIAPSNTNRLYMMYRGVVYRSDNKGVAWSKTSFVRVSGADPNDNYRTMGEKLAVDPVNADVVYVGTPNNGLWVTTNGGTSWSQVSGVPTGTSSQGGITGIVFDLSSGQTGGKTNTLYAASWGNGVYRSTNAGSSWVKTSGGPTTVHHGVVAGDGIYYATDGTAAWKYTSNAWSTIASNSWHSVAIDPTNPARIVLGSDGGYLSQSLDRGATWPQGTIWGGSPPITNVATDIPWLAWTKDSYKSNGNMMFDPTSSNKIYFAEGIGVWTTSIATNQAWNNGPVWTSQSLGIEQLVANEIISPPGGKPLVASWDRPVFYINNPDVFPSTHAPSNQYALLAGWGIDWASSNPSYIAAIMQWDAEKSGYSTDGGQTWSSFASFPPFFGSKNGGSIAVSTPSNIVWVPNNNGVPYFTKNGGTSWAQATFPGAPTTGETGWGWAYYLNRHVVAADRVTTSTFYAYNYLKGLYRSSDGGTTWALVKSGEITPFSGYNAKLRTVPGKAGELYFTGGPQSGETITSSTGQQFMRSTDGGATWSAIANVTDVYDFGFGAPAAAGGYPSMYIVGFVNNMYGVWESDNAGGNWKRVGLWPTNSLDVVKAVSGDMNQYGRVYVGFSGSGFVYGDISGGSGGIVPTPPVADTTPPSAPTGLAATAVSSSQINLTWTASSDAVGVTGYKIYRGGTQIGTSITANYSSTGLSASTQYSYTVAAYDAAGNTSAQSTAVSATTQTVADTTAPIVTITAPSGQLSLGTTQTTLSVTTNESATCAYATSSGVAYASMTQMAATGGTSHTSTLSGLSGGTSYTYYVKCRDGAGNTSADSSTSFSIASSGGGGGSTVTFTATAAPVNQSINYGNNVATFSSVNIGTPFAGRIVVVGVAMDGSFNTSVVGVTIGGVSATKAVASNPAANSGSTASLWYATLPSGSTADVVVTQSGTCCTIAKVGIAVGVLTGATATPTTTAYYDAPGWGSLGSVSIAPPTNGVVLIVADGSGAEESSAVITNASNLSTTATAGSNMTTVFAYTATAGSQTHALSTGWDFGGAAIAASAWGP